MGRLTINLVYARRALGVIIVLFITSGVYLYTSRAQKIGVEQISNVIDRHELVVGTEVINSHQRVYYEFESTKAYLSQDGINSSNPRASGPYIAWVSTPDGDNSQLIYLYNAINGSTKQITFYGTVQGLDIDKNHLVWTDQTAGSVIKYFDGQTVRTISEDGISSRPRIHDNLIAYAQYFGDKNWRVMLYHIDTKQTEKVSEGPGEKSWPRFIDGKLVTDNPD